MSKSSDRQEIINELRAKNQTFGSGRAMIAHVDDLLAQRQYKKAPAKKAPATKAPAKKKK